MQFLLYKVTAVIMLINGLAFFYLQQNRDKVDLWLLMPYRIKKYKEYTRIYLSAFAHIEIWHIGMNLFGLWIFGQVVEPAIGSIALALVYIFILTIGGIYVTILRGDHYDYAALGASGGVFGLLPIYALVDDNHLIGMPIPMLPEYNVILWAWLSAILTQLPKAALAGISHEGHMGGLVGGLLACIPLMFFMNSSVEKDLWWILVSLAPMLILATIKLLKPQLLYKNHRKYF